MSAMETCQVCKKAYIPETRKYKLDGFLEANKICDGCFEKVMRWILLGNEDYCICQKLEIERKNLMSEQRKLLLEEQNLRILQAGKMRKIYD